MASVTAGYDGPAGDPSRYAPLAAAYAGAVGGYTLWFSRSGRRLPEHTPAGDLALLGVATFRLSRLISRDRVTSFLRAPFTRYEGNAPGPEVNEEPRGEGERRSVGELLSCPFCVSVWAATALTGLYLAAPTAGRAAASLLAAVTISDGLQYAETALHHAVT
ncbi:MAG TPA: DUF1360 domain-containing protein [Acidimicrobiales bacterium]|nr:DUF1360 domain-containing protein [Acidimicrobiales bacterium]